MIVNVSESPVVIGRFRVLPGAKLPGVALTDKEAAGVKHLLSVGKLKEQGGAEAPKPVAVSATKPEPVAVPVEEPAPVAEEVSTFDEPGKGRGRKKG